MYIQVRLLNSLSQALWYQVPDDGLGLYSQGTIVHVPLRSKIVPALVLNLYHDKPNVSFSIRKVSSIEPFPNDTHYYSFLEQLSTYYALDSIHFIKRIRHFLIQKEKEAQDIQLCDSAQSGQHSVILTKEQQRICDALMPSIENPSYSATLVHGVTGSGKTEIYKQLVHRAYECNKTVILLAPEVSLALQLESVFKKSMENVPVIGFHSAATAKQKKIVWNMLVHSKPVLLIGVHLPILLPVANLGLIIVDEEHEVGYQEKKHPKINSKEAALLRASSANIPILLGSATPSISSLYNVKYKGWQFFQLKRRFSGTFPTIKTVLLTEKRQRKQFWITKELQDAIRDRLRKKEQIIIFLNRRGYSFFVQCCACSFIFSCKACSVSLTLHNDNTLACHYCDFTSALPSFCPSCKANEKQLLKKGIGTQQVVSILQDLFPAACIGRADFDVSSKKKLWKQTVHDFEKGLIDILVGTQTIAKGFHFPNVTLVGILWADLNLNMPVYNATERALQQLIQVAGRAGRQHGNESTVIVQTMNNHSVFMYVDELQYLNFYKEELYCRHDLLYPPFSRLAEIEFKHSDEHRVESESKQCSIQLMQYSKLNSMNVMVLGPARPPVYKVKHIHIRKIYLKAVSIDILLALYKHVTNNKSYRSSIFFTPNPL